MSEWSTKQRLAKRYERFRADFPLFAEKCLKVRDHHSQQIVPFVLNRGQRIFHAIVEKQKAEKGFVRVLLLKARRFGGSTYIEGRVYWRTSLRRNHNAFIIGHEEESTRTLYQMAQLFQELNPLPPSTRKSNAQELVFDRDDGKGLKSAYRLATAKNLSAGRSQGIHDLHDSEEGFWANADILLPSLLACLPPPPADTEVFRESTANGFGNTFQTDVFDTYQGGRYPYCIENDVVYAWHNPESDWVLAFIPWFVHDIYSMEFDSDSEKEQFQSEIDKKVFNQDTVTWGDSEAKKLQTKHGLALEQLHWRDWAVKNICKGRVEIFHQEYPSTVEEAFLASGSNVFSVDLCDIAEAGCREPMLIGDVVDRNGVTAIRPNPYGHFRLWEKPDPEFSYFITVDTAGGIKKSQELTQRQPDPSCIDVFNHKTGKQAAQWHGHMEYDQIAWLVEMIGKMYYRARACVEINNHGYTVVADLKRANYPMYCAKEDEPGWITNSKTKPQMVDALFEAIRDGALQISCKETVSEMRTFIEKSGKYEAAPGCHDERVDTACMGAMMMKLMPRDLSKDTKRRNSFTFSNWENRSGGSRYDGSYQEVYV